VKSRGIDTLDAVREFHEKCDQPIHHLPYLDDEEVNELRLDLLYEELNELKTALKDGNEAAVLDALTDIQYVLDGTYLSLGFHGMKEAAFREIHRSNLSKLENGKVLKRADGKVLKGKSYRPPNLAPILEAAYADDR